jgi:hypothetical protein
MNQRHRGVFARQCLRKSLSMQWCEAFDKHDPSVLDRSLDENWVDVPTAHDQAPRPEPPTLM